MAHQRSHTSARQEQHLVTGLPTGLGEQGCKLRQGGTNDCSHMSSLPAGFPRGLQMEHGKGDMSHRARATRGSHTAYNAAATSCRNAGPACFSMRSMRNRCAMRSEGAAPLQASKMRHMALAVLSSESAKTTSIRCLACLRKGTIGQASGRPAHPRRRSSHIQRCRECCLSSAATWSARQQTRP